MREPAAHLSCQEVVELVTEYLDAAMTPEQTEVFEQHLNFCEGCVSYVGQIRITAVTVGRVAEEDVPADARDALLTAFRHWRGA